MCSLRHHLSVVNSSHLIAWPMCFSQSFSHTTAKILPFRAHFVRCGCCIFAVQNKLTIIIISQLLEMSFLVHSCALSWLFGDSVLHPSPTCKAWLSLDWTPWHLIEMPHWFILHLRSQPCNATLSFLDKSQWLVIAICCLAPSQIKFTCQLEPQNSLLTEKCQTW